MIEEVVNKEKETEEVEEQNKEQEYHEDEDLPEKVNEFRLILQNASTFDPVNIFYKIYCHRNILRNMDADA